MSNPNPTGEISQDVNSVPSQSFRFLEWFVLLLVALPVLHPVPIFFLLPLVVIVVVSSPFVVPILIYRDASRIRALDLDWRPNARRYAAAAFLASPLIILANPLAPAIHVIHEPLYQLYRGSTGVVTAHHVRIGPPLFALYYLHKRHQNVRPGPVSGRWWLVLPATVAGGLLLLVAKGLFPASVSRVAGLGVSPLFAVFPAAAYYDAVYIVNGDGPWNPNPPLHLLLAFVSIVVYPLSLLYPLYAAYYLIRRAKGVGESPSETSFRQT